MILNRHQIETIAKAIHEDYRKNYRGNKYDMPWDELSEDIRQTNCNQAAVFVEYLEQLGLECSTDSNVENVVEQLTDKQIDAIAERIHIVWMRCKEETGWVYGSIRNDEEKIHPLMISYTELPEYEKDKDKAVARSIVPLMNMVKIRVYDNKCGKKSESVSFDS